MQKKKEIKIVLLMERKNPPPRYMAKKIIKINTYTYTYTFKIKFYFK